jgi:hypothetical protein
MQFSSWFNFLHLSCFLLAVNSQQKGLVPAFALFNYPYYITNYFTCQYFFENFFYFLAGFLFFAIFFLF